MFAFRYTLWAFTVAGNATVGPLAGAARRNPGHSWQRLDVTAAVRRWAGSGKTLVCAAWYYDYVCLVKRVSKQCLTLSC